MLTSRRVRPGRVRLAVFPYHFTRGSLQWSSYCSDRGHFPSTKGTSLYATTTRSRTGVDLEVVFLVGPPSTLLEGTLLEAHTRSLGWKMRDDRCSSVDERPGCGYEVMTRMLVLMMTWCQDEVRRSRAEIMWVVTCRDHVSRSCEWSRVEIMWLVGLMTMTLQLPSFSETSSVERVVVWLKSNLEWEPGKKPPNQWVRLKRKTGG